MCSARAGKRGDDVMSVRVYKVRKLDLAEYLTFNLWHDDELMMLLAPYDQRDEEGSGYMSFSKDELEEALQTASQERPHAILTQMIADAAASEYGCVVIMSEAMKTHPTEHGAIVGLAWLHGQPAGEGQEWTRPHINQSSNSYAVSSKRTCRVAASSRC